MGYGGYGLGWGLLRICFETDASFETREQNREQKSEVTKMQGWGNDCLRVHIYIYMYTHVYSAQEVSRRTSLRLGLQGFHSSRRIVPYGSFRK